MEPTPVSDPIKSAASSAQIRDLSGKFSKIEPPLVSFSITNPVTYLRKWWKGVMDGEGVDIRLKIHPFTAVLIIATVSGVSFGIGRISVPEPIAGYLAFLSTPMPSPTFAPSPTPAPIILVDAAFAGVLQQQGTRYVLVGSDMRAIVLQIDQSLSLEKYLGKRILASGKYNSETRLLIVEHASDLEEVKLSVPLAIPEATPMLPLQTPEM